MSTTRIALIGCGGIQNKHAQIFHRRDDAQIVALCDPSEEAIGRLIERSNLAEHGDPPPVYSDLGQMYAQVKPDAVSIATPHTMHFEQAMQALDAGCHVLMEKPMVTQADHAYTLRDKVSETGKVFLVAYNTPCSPEMKYIRDIVRSGELGKLELINGHLSQGWLQATVGMWRQKPELSGGGQAYDSGAHPLASLCWTVESRIVEVYAMIDNCGTPVDINSAFVIKFENGVLASISISGNCPVNGADMHYMFTDGKISFQPWSAEWVEVHKGKERVKYPQITDPPTMPADNFLESIAGRAQVRVSTDMGITLSELMDAIYESARTGKPASPKSRS